MVTGEMKVATVDVEASDNMATLPVGRTLGGPPAPGGGSQSDTAEKNNAANKEMELKNVMPKPLQSLSPFSERSLTVLTREFRDVVYLGTHRDDPNGELGQPHLSPTRGGTPLDGGHSLSASQAVVEPTPDPEVALSPRCKRKTTTDPVHGSFFLRVGAIAFGLGTMIYTGLEFGSFFEIPFTSPCHQILRGVNPLLQMIFTFMQMYFIFMNARLNIHRFKVLARFGLMHIVATNVCVWIRTLVLESLKEITAHHQNRVTSEPEDNPILENLRQHTLRNAGMVMGTELGPREDTEWEPISVNLNAHEDLSQESSGVLSKIIQNTVQTITDATSTTTRVSSTSSSTTPSTTTTTTASAITSTITSTASNLFDRIRDIVVAETTSTESSSEAAHLDSTTASTTTTTAGGSFLDQFVDHVDYMQQRNNSLDQTYESLESLFPQAFIATSTAISTANGTVVSCGRVNIMGTIVQDSAPYLYPFIIEYSLIGAAVIYVMWKHIGRYPKFTSEEDLEHRLEVMLSRRAVVMAQQARTGRVDCVGASKGLFFGLLLLVGSLICLILFFVLVRHPQLSLLAIYLADASHCILMVLAVFAIIIGFIRVQNLKFRCEEQSNLNDILLRISAFGLFIYSTFSVIAGSLNAMESEPNLLVMVTGIVAVVQVIIQLLFIADVSRRRVHLPEHDRIKPGRQIVTFLLICNVSMFAIYTFEAQKVTSNPVQLEFYGFLAWSLIQRVTLPLCIFHRFHSAVTLAEIWKSTYKARLE
ncbi:otopetrin [Culex quinquefasciatus]|uniref:Otopetrin n=1 Tax=Culex quinquefasciatus TaxID=7176 RepID=B0XFD6_CULQU|nr:otopetrin [Culex quinquefasciatus]|eukprot:XP_001868358.1 otopetrin [Culex quinquefasciatus]